MGVFLRKKSLRGILKNGCSEKVVDYVHNCVRLTPIGFLGTLAILCEKSYCVKQQRIDRGVTVIVNGQKSSYNIE